MRSSLFFFHVEDYMTSRVIRSIYLIDIWNSQYWKLRVWVLPGNSSTYKTIIWCEIVFIFFPCGRLHDIPCHSFNLSHWYLKFTILKIKGMSFARQFFHIQNNNLVWDRLYFFSMWKITWHPVSFVQFISLIFEIHNIEN